MKKEINKNKKQINNDPIVVKCVDFTFDGQGLSKDNDNRVYFVPSLLIDEEINLDFIGENPENFREAFKIEDEKNRYSNTYSNYFKEKNCLFALPNVEGFKYLIN